MPPKNKDTDRYCSICRSQTLHRWNGYCYECTEHTEEDEAAALPQVRDFYREHQEERDSGRSE
jgi:hypothetical protein